MSLKMNFYSCLNYTQKWFSDPLDLKIVHVIFGMKNNFYLCFQTNKHYAKRNIPFD